MQSRIPSQNGQGARSPRSDVRRNHGRLVAAACAVFTEHGADASLEEIARRAGLGIATLYRHFATREALLARVLDDSALALIARAHELKTVSSPTEAVVLWLDATIAYIRTYDGLSKSLAAGMGSATTDLGSSCQAMCNAGAMLLQRAQDAGELRTDVDMQDVMMGVQASVWAAEQTANPAATPRLLAIFVDGLRVAPARRALARPHTARRATTSPRAPRRSRRTRAR